MLADYYLVAADIGTFPDPSLESSSLLQMSACLASLVSLEFVAHRHHTLIALSYVEQLEGEAACESACLNYAVIDAEKYQAVNCNSSCCCSNYWGDTVCPFEEI